jgi:hypothetical protein
MKGLLKKFALYAAITSLLLSAVTPVMAANPKDKCQITVNGDSVTWKSEPFLAYGPQGDVKIMLPMKELFTELGYTVTHNAKQNRTIFTADKNSSYESFYINLKTGQIAKEGEEPKKGELNCAYLINDKLYSTAGDYFGLDKIAKSFLDDSAVVIDYNYIHNKNEIYISDYKNYVSIQNNLSFLIINISPKYPDHPYIGEQYTKYNTGTYITGSGSKTRVCRRPRKSNFKKFMGRLR